MVKQKQQYESPFSTELFVGLSNLLANSLETTNEDFTLDETLIKF